MWTAFLFVATIPSLRGGQSRQSNPLSCWRLFEQRFDFRFRLLASLPSTHIVPMFFRERGIALAMTKKSTEARMPENILIAIAWPYANAEIHVGNITGSHLPGDIVARYHDSKGIKFSWSVARIRTARPSHWPRIKREYLSKKCTKIPQWIR